MELVTTAHEAAERYKAFLEEDRLIQSGWHQEQDGRQLACALGVLGSDVKSPRACPASVMPRWLAQMVPAFFDNQKFEDAKKWGGELYEQLDRLNGEIPFSVVHDWQAKTVGPFAIELAEKQGRDLDSHKALAEIHWKAVTGEKFTAAEWKPILKAAFYDIYLWRYRATADATADANAAAYANAYANAAAYANANANANAAAYATAYATADANAAAYATAYANATAYAYATAAAYANAWKRLADGMIEALKRVEA